MANIWTIEELDPRMVFETIHNRDPETSTRFCLPVPNWLDDEGKSCFRHLQIGQSKKKNKTGPRFFFYNYMDSAEQEVKIDGSAAIVFTSPTPAQAAKLNEIISGYAPTPSDLTPEDMSNILKRAYYDLGLMDVFYTGKDEILSDMDFVSDGQAELTYGNYVYKNSLKSACIHIKGSGEFRGGPTVTPQKFNDAGCFVVFRGKTKAQAQKIISEFDLLEEQRKKPEDRIKAKIVATNVFLNTRRALDGRPLDMSAIPAQTDAVKGYYRPKQLTGFWEWLPEVRDIERQWIRSIEEVFERYGFANIETPAVEEVAVLTAKGEGSDKKMYNLQPSQENEDAKEGKLGLHYDLTVPMARYIVQHYQELNFPFKRYQIQKVWRGDRPRKGRAREFVQCDIDVVDRGNVSLEFDAEFPMIIHNLAKKLDIGDIVISINNRKILQGFCRGLGIDDDTIIQVFRVVDKMNGDKEEGVEGAKALLSEELGLSQEAAEKIVAIASIKGTEANITEKVLVLGIDTPLLREGLAELDFVMERLRKLPEGSVVADLSIARGLDYYTGTVYEGKFADYPDYPAILGGGRYDNLVGNFMKQSLPGVGISFGLTRVFAKLHDEGLLPQGKKTPTQAFVAIPAEDMRNLARDIVDDLRDRGIPSEISDRVGKLGKQLDYANFKDIPYVIIPDATAPDRIDVRDMRQKNQTNIALKDWAPGG